jgi:sugar transferase (PEP-CTERM/EpsH1 system associated)
MANVLYLVHRMPYPPDKGDKVRSYHVLRHLAARHRVFLGTFVDDPADWQHVPAVRELCAGVHAAGLNPRAARLRSLAALATGEPLTLRYYRDAGLARWVKDAAARERIDAAVVFSSSMAPYAKGLGVPVLVDFVDVDSAKWAEYAPRHAWPLSWLYRREGEKLLACEREVAGWAGRSFFVTEKEAQLFRGLAPESAGRVEAMSNGVDCDHFAPDLARPSPFTAGELPVVFTGAMDYWPNIDAVNWFAAEMLPALRAKHPQLRFHIVGRNPAPAVQALAGTAVNVTGTVPDVRPYLQHAAVVVAPLRLARGIQNKVLEAMAMGQAVVAAQSCVQVLDVEAGREIVPAADGEAFVREVGALLDDPARARAMGAAARQRVLRSYAWSAHLSAIDRHLAGLGTPAPGHLAAFARAHHEAAA